MLLMMMIQNVLIIHRLVQLQEQVDVKLELLVHYINRHYNVNQI
ncbi:unnamed protein product (macronuclear) [Paramecium tetraurelia]|uniref:Uncharacterized protein n=1 Tax=Paramecium tetraurelia TaxID=5888 RepID=A0BSV3_PARTE|nr:uncharacterized protein GSPATT00031852001 [Paramecium tetraurelia]CAK61620.1 unnamed protein product [Paramecium tetraurelia]